MHEAEEAVLGKVVQLSAVHLSAAPGPSMQYPMPLFIQPNPPNPKVDYTFYGFLQSGMLVLLLCRLYAMPAPGSMSTAARQRQVIQ
jgi:hypothetical protein